MLKLRVIAALVGIPVIVFSIYTGGLFYFGLILLIALKSLSEYLKMVTDGERVLPAPVAYLAALLVLAVHYYNPDLLAFSLSAIFLTYGLMMVFLFPKLKPWELMSDLWGITYIAGFLSFLYPLRALDQGFALTLLLFLGVWANDTGAYFTGLSLGRRKLAPLLSPNKTVEGFLGGIVATVAVLSVYGYFMNIIFIVTLLAAVLIAFAGAVGDLVVSALKRHFQVKDTGTIIPGHGGFLDRFDSIIFAVPLLFMFLHFFL